MYGAFKPKSVLLFAGLFMVPVFAYLIWMYTVVPETLTTLTSHSAQAGEEIRKDLQILPALAFIEGDETYQVIDTKTEGIDIQFANAKEVTLAEGEKEKQPLTISFPKDYTEPLQIKLDDQRSLQITDLSGVEGYTADTLSIGGSTSKETLFPGEQPSESLFQRIRSLGGSTSKSPEGGNYLRYTSEDERKTLLYAFQKDQATGEKKLKHWTLYQEGTGLENERYRFETAKLRINESGDAEVYYFPGLQNDTATEVDQSLMARAERTLAKEMGEDIARGGHTPDFTIPRPYAIDRNGDRHDLEWKLSDEDQTLSVTLSLSPNDYPLALDPTLSFTAPGVSNAGAAISGETTSNNFGYAMTSGDFNADGRTDLAVGAYGYSTSTGRAYLFYGDGTLATDAMNADVIITGEATNNYFGRALTAGDFNADGRTDLAVGAFVYSTNTGRTYLFYNDGSIPTTAATADVTITGEATGNYFGRAITAGDFNADGRTDLAVGAMGYSTNTGRAYIFYNDGSIPTTAATADVIITGEATGNYFGNALTPGDFNADGETDLVVGAYYYSTNTGRAYIFYNDGSIPTTAATADVTITGEGSSHFASSLTADDFNADGKTDLAVGATGYSTNTGRAYIFYNDGSIPTTAATADVIITGEATSNYFGLSLTTGDFNADGKTDLAVGAYGYSSNTGRVYIFYGDGSIPTTAATADVTITGEATSNYFGLSLTSGDFNADGRTDLAVGAYGYSSFTGRTYLFYSQNGQVNTNQHITGEATSDEFGKALVTGDFNADGRMDLAVGAPTYDPGGAASTGRAYIFYSDGQIPTAAGTADVTITGNAASDLFGFTLTSGDFNADGKTDLVVGAYGYSGNTGRAYIFYNDGSIPTTAATADVTITGETTSNYFSHNFTVGDFNADGRADLVVGAERYSSYTGRAYIFYNDGSIPTTAATADVILTGNATADRFSDGLQVADLDADGKVDLIVGAYEYSSSTGRVYVFYNDGSIPTTAATADVTITGDTSIYFGKSLSAGDFNADGRTDLAVGAYGGSGTGRAYIFYGGGSIPTTAATADIIIVGEATNNYFGFTLVSGDFNADGRTDLAVGAYRYSTDTGRTYLFYNDGSIPTAAATADVTITGETTSNYFGYALVTSDFNADGRSDLIVGTYGHTSSTGKVYLYETRENFAWELQRQFDPSGTAGLRTGLNTSGQELKITGEATSSFGTFLTSGDFNSDGRTDLAVGASDYSSNTGRVYIFYSDGTLATGATNADVIITGETTSNYFGISLTASDFNADGRTDLAVGAYGYSTNTGRAYIFYGDGSIPTTAATADVTITGETTSNYFGRSLTSGDFNTDGRTDLAVGAFVYSTNTGRAYLFYNDGSIPTTAATADLTITGETTSNYFGRFLTSGDFNADGRTDLVVGAMGYSTDTGRAYIFYNDGSIPTTAATADVIITGGATGNYFGHSLTSGDFNADGRTDLAVGAYYYSTNTGRAYIFYNDGSIPTTAATADVTITGEGSSHFGQSLTPGDFNADGRTDLAVGATGYSTNTGRAYIFYNDGSIPTTAATADVTITGETTSNYFGISLMSGDFNADGRTDLVAGATGYSTDIGRTYIYTFGNDSVIVGETTTNYFSAALASGDFNSDGRMDLVAGAPGYSSSTGRVYVFYNNGGAFPAAASSADVTITGETTSNDFGRYRIAVGDFNSDGRTDFAASAAKYSTNTGRVYIFHNDGSIPTTAATADVIITGEATNNYFGPSLAAGDFNADGKTDLAAGAGSYSAATGRVYLFYNDGSIPTTAATADVIITGNASGDGFSGVAAGDFNADGRTDLAVGADGYSTQTGRVYIFHNDGSIPTTAATADVTITGETSGNYFGSVLTSGDLNADGRSDLAVSAYSYSTNTGRVYIFHNDGSIPTTAVTADVTITGETSGDYFGWSSAAGDLNADGKTDLAVGAYQYSSSTGRVYIFHNDGSIPTTAATADVKLTGETTGYYFGYTLATGDLNTDSKTDLLVGAWQYSSGRGRAFIFTSEAAAATTPPGQSFLKGVGKLRGNMQWK